MKKKKCWIVMFDEFTRRACLESLDENDFGAITVFEDGKKVPIINSWKTDISFVQRIFKMGNDQGKKMDFRVVVERQDGTLRFARKSEWIPTCKKQKSLKRTINSQLSKIHAKKIVRARIGTIS